MARNSSKSEKPGKPYPEFPLFAHNNGQWAKKIRGKLRYFGAWSDWEGALREFQRTIHDLRAGREPDPIDSGGLSLLSLANKFLHARRQLVDSGELEERTWVEYKSVLKRLVDSLGRDACVSRLTPADFAELRASMVKKWGLKTVHGEITKIRVLFNYAIKAGLIDSPVAYGIEFNKPSQKAIKKEQMSKPAKVFTIDELRSLLGEANATMRAFILLALNGGMGGTDIGLLEPRHIQDGWINFPRPKTLVDRTFALWPETQKAIEGVRRGESSLPYLFVTKRGLSWAKSTRDSPVSKEFRKLSLKCKCHKEGRSFYALRHQFRTIADEARDVVAIDRIMGHKDNSMGAVYREWIAPDRIRAVTDHVREWLLPALV